MSEFSPECFNFLNLLSVNNDREWFKANQQQYEDKVRTPALKFIEAMQPHILGLSPRLTAVPKKVGGSMMRPQRDSRFSKDKTPYKTNVGIQFRHFQGKDVHAPGLYLHIANDGCFIGAGIWHPESKALNAIRSCIDENPNGYKKALRELTTQGFEMQGSKLIRPPKGYDKANPMLEELKRKDFIAIKPLTIEQICQADFAETCAHEFAACQQLMRYLCFALDLDY
ncbi:MULTISPECIES: DUF2461 domain-containing protein [unclassified Shewanella]|uniref:DUF2461 domain-containing protein n=1 Tax=unclassified Shewanella TaxID=196818 RepID=UPI001BBF96D0|nr:MULTISPECIES: DUF2461 domain-containing protein [unclassified Shewanella]GIU19638.1 TIGR02453 family protein [Shewanella sp. MBTL60-112-B1]GIU27569.1 TIGR02453 family protein [Shewanella sp. MBTL60-112-B2]